MTRVPASGVRVFIGCAVLAAACGRAPRVTIPSGGGVPFPGFSPAYAESIAECRAVKTISASLSLSGRAGSTKMSARIDAGFAEPGRLRLEGYPKVSFGGKPFFVLVARGGDATLVLNRDARVLRNAAPGAIIEALTGIALDPDELRAIVSGCGLGVVDPSGGQSYENGWASVESAGGTIFLRQLDGRWRVAAVRSGALTVEYGDFSGGRPSVVRLHTAGQKVAAADLTLRLSQVEANAPLEAAVFSADVPREATPISLDELRRAGPLGEPQRAP